MCLYLHPCCTFYGSSKRSSKYQLLVAKALSSSSNYTRVLLIHTAFYPSIHGCLRHMQTIELGALASKSYSATGMGFWSDDLTRRKSSEMPKRSNARDERTEAVPLRFPRTTEHTVSKEWCARQWRESWPPMKR